MFAGDITKDNPPKMAFNSDLSRWDVSKVESMRCAQ
jgi:hypothetical protein